MTLAPHEFIRRFLLQVLQSRFHRIRHYGLIANANRAANIAKARELLGTSPDPDGDQEPEAAPEAPPPCPRCGGQKVVIETFEPRTTPRHKPNPHRQKP